MSQALNNVVRAKDLRRGMVVLPFRGDSTFQKPWETLDWTHALHYEWWQHIVVGIDAEYVKLARPFAYAREHFDTNVPLIGCEVYTVPRDSNIPFMVQRENFTT